MNHPRLDTVRVLALVAALLLAAGPATAGEARALAMGGVHTATARGLDAGLWNPAALAFSPGGALGLAGMTVDMHNNSFTLGRYNEISGATLNQSEKERLLADIPDGGFRLDAGVRASGPGLHLGRLAVTTSVVASGRGNLDRDFFDLLLFGNALGQTVDFSDTWGEGHAVGKASLSWGQPVYAGALGRIAAGATVSYLQGLYELHVEEARGQVTTGMTEIAGEAYAAAVTSDGGSGYGVDLGAAWLAPGGWSFGLALDNAMSAVNWTGNPERHEVRVTATDINLLNDDLEDAIADTDTSYAASGYGTTLPPRLRLGAAWDRGTLLLAADYVQGLSDRAGSGTTPALNLGVEWRPLGVLTPRGGLMLGGPGGFGLAGGLGLNMWWWQVDLAVVQRGGLGGDATKGLGFGISSQLVF